MALQYLKGAYKKNGEKDLFKRTYSDRTKDNDFKGKESKKKIFSMIAGEAQEQVGLRSWEFPIPGNVQAS